MRDLKVVGQFIQFYMRGLGGGGLSILADIRGLEGKGAYTFKPI